MNLRHLVSSVRSIIANSGLGMDQNDAWYEEERGEPTIKVRYPAGKRSAVLSLLKAIRPQMNFTIIEKEE